MVKCSMTIKTDPGIPARTQCKPGGFPSALKEPFLCNQLPLVSSIQNTFISRCAAQTVQVLSMIVYICFVFMPCQSEPLHPFPNCKVKSMFSLSLFLIKATSMRVERHGLQRDVSRSSRIARFILSKGLQLPG